MSFDRAHQFLDPLARDRLQLVTVSAEECADLPATDALPHRRTTAVISMIDASLRQGKPPEPKESTFYGRF
jgi:hypothetical protein